MPAVKPSSLPDKTLRQKLLTIYGRNPVLEALSRKDLDIYRLHLANSNKKSDAIETLLQLAKARNVEVLYHDRLALSRISRSARQDQGVALDIIHQGFCSIEDFLSQNTGCSLRLLALDGITNPQNVGMIIRSATASGIDAIIIPQKGCANIDSLVIKASAGTLFRARIIRCQQLDQALETLLEARPADCCLLDGAARQSLFAYKPSATVVFVLGNETSGVSETVSKRCNKQLAIPMKNGVESLNVAAAATLACFHLTAND